MRRICPSLLVVCLLSALFAPFGALPAEAQEPFAGDDFGLFLPVDDGPAVLSGRGLAPTLVGGQVRRVRRVALDVEAFADLEAVLDRGGSPPAVRLNLFPDVLVESPVERRDFTAGGWSWSGGVAGDPHGSVAMAVNGGVVHGIVRTEGRLFTVRRVGDGAYSITEVAENPRFEGAPPLDPPRRAVGDPPVAAYVDDPSRVDIAVFYTSAARREAGGRDEIHAMIDAYIADTNAAYVRSGIDHRLNLVFRGRVSYTERSSTDDAAASSQALECFRDDDDGCLDIEELRREYSADLVHLLINTTVPAPDAGSDVLFNCGTAFITGDYAVSELFCGSTTFAHEVGHNSGMRHDRYVEYDDDCDTDPDVPCFPASAAAYAYGYINQLGLALGAPIEHRWRTLMAYGRQCSDADTSCPVLMRFSNPEQSWQGDRLGVSGSSAPRRAYTDGTDAAKRGPADAARTHREFAFDLANRVPRKAPDLVVKGFRPDRSQVEPGATVWLTGIIENLGISTGPITNTVVTWCRTTGSSCSSASSVGRSDPIPTLSANNRLSYAQSVAVPRSVGSHTYLMCVSAAPGETLTKNNCAEPVTVDVGVVDLDYSMSLSSNSVLSGASLGISGVVSNRGTIASSSGRLVFGYLDSADDPVFSGSGSFLALGAGSSTDVEITVEAPSAPGQYSYFGCLSSAHVEFDCVWETLTVRRSGGAWSAQGVGNTVLDVPTDVRVVSITGEYTGYSSNFIIWCGLDPGGLVVNELLGTGWGATTYSGVHSALRDYNRAGQPCREFEIENSASVRWSIAERTSGSGVASRGGTGTLAGDLAAVEASLNRARRLQPGR